MEWWVGAVLLSWKLHTLWRHSAGRVGAIFSAEWVGGCAPLDLEASYAVASLRQSCCWNAQCGVGGWGGPLEQEASYAVASLSRSYSCSTQCGLRGGVQEYRST